MYGYDTVILNMVNCMCDVKQYHSSYPL